MRRTFLGLSLSAALLLAGRAAAEEPYSFTWHTLALAAMKLNPYFDYEAHAGAYLKADRPRLWEKVRNNEFEYDRYRQESVRLMKERVEQFSLDRDILIRTDLRLGKYDFRKNAFPVENVSETHYWYNDRYVDDPYPSRYRVFVSNHELLATIPMSREEAEPFVSRRTSRFGEITREVPANIRLRILREKDSPGELMAEIQQATVFGDANRREVIYEVAKPEPKKKAPAAPKP